MPWSYAFAALQASKNKPIHTCQNDLYVTFFLAFIKSPHKAPGPAHRKKH